MKVVILCGGQGTRLREETEFRPKPLVEIGGWPILWHIMRLYSAYGYNEFILALGYKGEIIKDYFLNYYYLRNNLSMHLDDGRIDVQGDNQEKWVIHLIDTGLLTGTGGRIKRVAHWIGDETFMVTYGDGLADINIRDLVAFHRRHGKLATITAVRPPARFGALQFNGDLVARFTEKSQASEGWINGGFFVLEPGVFDYIAGDSTHLELDPLERLSEDRQLVAYRHESFWQCMDTLRDLHLLENIWQSGKAPWKM